MCKHNPLNCIIPPYMVEHILQNGTPQQVEKARDNFRVSGQLRGQRQSFAEIAPQPQAEVGLKNRRIYDAQHGSDFPGTLVRSEGQPPTGDPAADEAYDGAGATYDFYYELFERNSIDDKGLDLVSIVHYLESYDNAFWDGEKMVYGDGDEDMAVADRLFNRFTIAVDIIGHELTHGVTQFEANLIYQGQPGALNESISDVFGSLVKQRVKQQTVTEADWLIGEGLFTENVKGKAIRSMKAPGTAYDDPVLGKDPQPAHMSNYVETTSDNGGVHINSGIPNKAFYEVALEIGGYAWEKAGKIWYVTLRDKLDQNADFQEAADKTYETAGELYGVGSMEQKAVQNGWQKVGISTGSTGSDGESDSDSGSTGGSGNPEDKKGCLGVLASLLFFNF